MDAETLFGRAEADRRVGRLAAIVLRGDGGRILNRAGEAILRSKLKLLPNQAESLGSRYYRLQPRGGFNYPYLRMCTAVSG